MYIDFYWIFKRGINIFYRLFFVMPKWANSRKNCTVRYWRGGGSHGYNWFRRYSILSQFCSKSKHQSSLSPFISQNWCHWFCSFRTQRCISGTKQRSNPFDLLVGKRVSFDEISSHLEKGFKKYFLAVFLLIFGYLNWWSKT